MKSKRGEAGTNIAALILITALLIVLYIVSIPVDLREELLPGTSSGGINNGGDRIDFIDSEKVLLSAFPGEVTPFGEESVVKEFVPVLLYSRLEKSTIDLSKTTTLEKSFFIENDRSFEFDLNDVENIEKFELFLFVVKGKGKVKIELNGNLVFEDEIESSRIPISLPINGLRNKNELKLISSRGFGDDYQLNDIKLIVTTRSNNKVASRDFSLTDNEKNGLEGLTLSYFVNCLSLKEQGRLSMTLNNRLLFNDFVFCDSGLNKIDISPDRVKSGLNRFEFNIDRGDYQLDDIQVELSIGEISFPKYNFQVDDEDFDRTTGLCGTGFDRCIRECDFDCGTDSCFDRCTEDCEFDFDCKGDSNIILRLDFKDERGSKIKRANIAINEDTVSFDVVDSFYERDISSFVRRGDNAIKIIPKTSFEIERLTIFLE
ncbi:hypothetical protein HYX15_00920 [Candidatus Woesearchaeota archaeon]|nr:hypothetical protein [Candidatus Woesearchaeota archaeon]